MTSITLVTLINDVRELSYPAHSSIMGITESH